MDYLSINMTDEEISGLGALALAHVGDAVYELLVRSWLCAGEKRTSKSLHTKTVAFVRAGAQARAAQALLPALSARELAVFKRGRNAKVNSVPKNADPLDYHAATGLEALFGYLYLKGEKARISELFMIILEEN